jgi:hypothetical protein
MKLWKVVLIGIGAVLVNIFLIVLVVWVIVKLLQQLGVL